MAGRSRRLRVALPITLLVMILMRLVWMQLRSYPVVPELRALVSLAELEAAEICDYDKSLPRPQFAVDPTLGAQRAWILSPGFAALGFGGCLAGWSDDREFVRLNQWLLASTVLLCVFLARFISSSWTVALMVGAMLMSRGRLLADISRVSIDFLAMLAVTAWITTQAHFVRTGAKGSLVTAMVVAFAAVFIDRSLIVLGLATPLVLAAGFLARRRLARPVIRHLRGAQEQAARFAPLIASPLQHSSDSASHLLVRPRLVEPGGSSPLSRLAANVRWTLGMEVASPAAQLFETVTPIERPTESRGGLFRTLSVPFLLWVYARRRWAALSGWWLCLAAAALGSALELYAVLGGSGTAAEIVSALATWKEVPFTFGEVWPELLRLFLERFDLHLTASLLIVLAGAVQSPASGLAGYLETAWLTLAVLVLSLGTASLGDAWDQSWVAAAGGVEGFGLDFPLARRDVAQWLEPAILSLGAIGVYNLMKVLDTRIAETR